MGHSLAIRRGGFAHTGSQEAGCGREPRRLSNYMQFENGTFSVGSTYCALHCAVLLPPTPWRSPPDARSPSTASKPRPYLQTRFNEYDASDDDYRDGLPGP